MEQERAIPLKKRRVIEAEGSDSTPSPQKSTRQQQPQNKNQQKCVVKPPEESPSSSSSTSSVFQWKSPFKLFPDVVAREKQLKLLKAALCHLPDQALPGALFLWGASSTGKSFTLEKALEGTGIHQIKVHSAEILCGRKAFYEAVVKQLISFNRRDLAVNFRCDNLRSLYANFYGFFNDENNRSTEVIIIVEAAENLRGEYDDILQFLISLQDITQAAICVVLKSSLPPVQFMPTLTEHVVIPIYFPQYTQDELGEILTVQKRRYLTPFLPSSCDHLYGFYVKMIIQMFFYVCRDVRKFRMLIQTHWKSFKEMVEEENDMMNLSKLWKRLEPQLKSQFFELNNSVTTTKPGGGISGKSVQQNKGLDMPSNSKYLLIACYLATHNPPSSDKRFFVKSKTGKGKKPRANATLKTENSAVAKSFELNRLQAIFSSIQTYCDDQTVNKNRNISFMTLLSTLCQNKLVQHLGEDSTGNQKYKCLLDYDTVLDISRSVNFELNNYLYRLI